MLYLLLFLASSVSFIEPKVNVSSSINLGVFYPNSVVTLIFDMNEEGRKYDRINVENITYETSSDYSNPYLVRLYLPSIPGNYTAKLSFIDLSKGNPLKEKKLLVSFFVEEKPFSVIKPIKPFITSPGDEAMIEFVIINEADVGETFRVIVSAYNHTDVREFFVPKRSKKIVRIPFSSNVEGIYSITVKVNPLHSKASEEFETFVVVESDLLHDLSAVEKGILLYPLPFSFVFYLSGGISSILDAVLGG